MPYRITNLDANHPIPSHPTPGESQQSLADRGGDLMEAKTLFENALRTWVTGCIISIVMIISVFASLSSYSAIDRNM
jgi:hypothetical protein